MNNYGGSDETLAQTSDSSRNKHLSTIKTTRDLDQLLNKKVSNVKLENEKMKSPKGKSAHEFTMLGVFDKAFPNFEPVKRTTQVTFAGRSASIDPNYTAHKPYGYKIDQDPEEIAL